MKIIEKTGSKTIGIITAVGEAGRLFGSVIYWSIFGRIKGGRSRLKETFHQMMRVGIKGLGVIFIVVGFVGVIFGLQLAYILERFGVVSWLPKAAGVTMFREFGPLLSAIVLSGYGGAAITAELATMKVSEEILALESQAINPIRFLIVPRVIAIVVMLVCITVLANIVGLFGSYIVGVWVINQDHHFFIRSVLDAVEAKDIISGFVKSIAFGILIGIISCYKGLTASGGAEGVGSATRSTVVLCIVAIIATDCIFTILFYMFF